MASPLKTSVEASVVNLACFEVKGQLFAIDVGYVQEIVRVPEVTPLPDAPRLIEGVIDLRGAVIPVVDLSRMLGRGRADEGLLARIVVLEIDGLVLGLQVDAATDVLTLDVRRLEAVPDLATQSGYDGVSAIVRRDGEAPVMVLCLETLVEKVHRSGSVGHPERGERA